MSLAPLRPRGVPISGTVRRVARPRGVIPDKERKALERAVAAKNKADDHVIDAAKAAIDAGGSWREVAKTAGMSLSKLQELVPPRKDRT